MTRDQSKFLNLKEENGGRLILGNNASTRIVGKATINIENGKTKDKSSSYVEDIKKLS